MTKLGSYLKANFFTKSYKHKKRITEKQDGGKIFDEQIGLEEFMKSYPRRQLILNDSIE